MVTGDESNTGAAFGTAASVPYRVTLNTRAAQCVFELRFVLATKFPLALDQLPGYSTGPALMLYMPLGADNRLNVNGDCWTSVALQSKCTDYLRPQ